MREKAEIGKELEGGETGANLYSMGSARINVPWKGGSGAQRVPGACVLIALQGANTMVSVI